MRFSRACCTHNSPPGKSSADSGHQAVSGSKSSSHSFISLGTIKKCVSRLDCSSTTASIPIAFLIIVCTFLYACLSIKPLHKRRSSGTSISDSRKECPNDKCRNNKHKAPTTSAGLLIKITTTATTTPTTPPAGIATRRLRLIGVINIIVKIIFREIIANIVVFGY